MKYVASQGGAPRHRTCRAAAYWHWRYPHTASAAHRANRLAPVDVMGDAAVTRDLSPPPIAMHLMHIVGGHMGPKDVTSLFGMLMCQATAVHRLNLLRSGLGACMHSHFHLCQLSTPQGTRYPPGEHLVCG